MLTENVFYSFLERHYMIVSDEVQLTDFPVVSFVRLVKFNQRLSLLYIFQQEEGVEITANALHPGAIATNLLRFHGFINGSFLAHYMYEENVLQLIQNIRLACLYQLGMNLFLFIHQSDVFLFYINQRLVQIVECRAV